jgi:hypothetical protein
VAGRAVAVAGIAAGTVQQPPGSSAARATSSTNHRYCPRWPSAVSILTPRWHGPKHQLPNFRDRYVQVADTECAQARTEIGHYEKILFMESFVM